MGWIKWAIEADPVLVQLASACALSCKFLQVHPPPPKDSVRANLLTRVKAEPTAVLKTVPSVVKTPSPPGGYQTAKRCPKMAPKMWGYCGVGVRVSVIHGQRTSSELRQPQECGTPWGCRRISYRRA